MINLRNAINEKEIPENENPSKIVDTVEKILDVKKQQKDTLDFFHKQLRILSRTRIA